jgi:hypothetical protein
LLKLWENFDGQKYPVLSLVAIALPGAISIALLVETYRLRRVQQRASGASYIDNEWGFGQIAAIAMYGPVLLEAIASVEGVLEGKKEHRNAAPGQHGQAAGGELVFRRMRTV